MPRRIGVVRPNLVLVLITCLIGITYGASYCRADIIYSNLAPAGSTVILSPATGSSLLTPDPYFAFGDHVTFGPGGRTVNSVRARFFLSPSFAPDPGQPMTTDVRFMIYEDDNGTVGSLLGTTTIFGHTFQSGVFTTLTFPNTSISVGESAFVALVTTNVVRTSPYEGYELFGVSATASGIPNPGSSDSFSMIKAFGFGLAEGSAAYDVFGTDSPAQNLRLEISAIPEPRFAQIWLALLLGLPLILRCRKAARLKAHPAQSH